MAALGNCDPVADWSTSHMEIDVDNNHNRICELKQKCKTAHDILKLTCTLKESV